MTLRRPAGHGAGGTGPRRLVILANPRTVGRRSFLRLRTLLEAKIGDARWRLKTVQAPDAVRRALPGLARDEVPVAAGGDGTVGMLATALYQEGDPTRPMGILPMGTGNLLARDLGLARLEEAVTALAIGSPSPVDVMRTDRPDLPLALVSLSAGFEADFLARYEGARRRSRLWGAAVGLAAAKGRWSLELVADGRPLAREGWSAYVVGLYNTRCYAGGALMSPTADPGDGVAEAVAYSSPQQYWTALGRGALRLPAPQGRGGRRSPWRHATLKTDGSIQVDGEPRPGGTVSVELVPGGLRVLAIPVREPSRRDP